METFADTLFDTDCALPYLPSYLEIRREHQLIKQNPGEVLGKQAENYKDRHLDSSSEFCS